MAFSPCKEGEPSQHPRRGECGTGGCIFQMSYTLRGSSSPPEVPWEGFQMACYCVLEPPFGATVSLEASQPLIMPSSSLCFSRTEVTTEVILVVVLCKRAHILKNPREPTASTPAPFLLNVVVLHSGARLAWWHAGGIRERIGHSKDDTSLGIRQTWAESEFCHLLA